MHALSVAPGSDVGRLLHRRYSPFMKTISQRELRNHSGEVMRGLECGESFRVTSRGIPIGVLSPGDRTTLDELTLRSPSRPMTFPEGVRSDERTEQGLAELRGDR